MTSTEKKRLCLPTGVVPSKHFEGLLMTSFPVLERPKSRRAKYPKVRTGCVSCKKRHVKCDEVKPSCNRCLKWSGVCGGYETPCRKSSSTKSLLYAAQTGAKSRSAKLPESPEIPTLDESLATLSVASSEPATPPIPHSSYQPFDYFNGKHDIPSSGGSSVGNTPMPDFYSHDYTAINSFGKIGILDASFWTDTIPRLVQDNLAVRYANMAVHILILSKQKQSGLPEQPDFGNDNYSLALAHYGLAIQQMRNSEEMCGGTRAAVLCSMLFAVFEALNGDREAAEAHLLCGQRMLNELQELLPRGIAATSAGSLRKELRNLLQYISLQVRIGGATCWKGECDAVCAELLDEFVAADVCDASSAYGSMSWPGSNDISGFGLDDFGF